MRIVFNKTILLTDSKKLINDSLEDFYRLNFLLKYLFGLFFEAFIKRIPK